MGYTNKENVQILISLLKQHGIKKIVVSPGTTNILFVASIQNDDWFHIFSAADERSAGYIACGMASESLEPVVITCTGATASRNYLPSLTEAYHRKLPILVITFLLNEALYGNLMPQVIDRTKAPEETVKMQVEIPEIHDKNDSWKANYLINKAILEMKHHTFGPVHINIHDTFSYDFSLSAIPKVRKIVRIDSFQDFPSINYHNIGIYIGEHKIFCEKEIDAIEKFCYCYDAVVIGDNTSNYTGNHKVNSSLILSQEDINKTEYCFDLLIDLGGITGDYYVPKCNCSWRIDPDGEVIDRFHNVEIIFEVKVTDFFNYFGMKENNRKGIQLEKWQKKYDDLYNKIIDIPFSNIWIAKQTYKKLPQGCSIHLGILNSLRSWNFFNIDKTITCYCNVGGFGIDGCISTLIGSSFINNDKLYFLFVGDLAFFYDMNSLGNHHIGNNIRIMMINNGCGTEFRNYSHPGNMFGEETNKYIAAGGHYGNKSKCLVKHYCHDLGFDYLSATTKEEFRNNIMHFVNDKNDRTIVFEIFTNPQDESDALKAIRNIEHTTSVKRILKEKIGPENMQKIKSIIKR